MEAAGVFLIFAAGVVAGAVPAIVLTAFWVVGREARDHRTTEPRTFRVRHFPGWSEGNEG